PVPNPTIMPSRISSSAWSAACRLSWSLISIVTYQIQEFISSVLIIFKYAEHRTGDGNGILLFHATHDHTEVLGLDDDSHTSGTNFLIDGFGNLSRQPFLNLESPGVHVRYPRDFTQADNAPFRNISHVTFTKERKQVMLAKAEQLDVAHDDHFVVGHIEQSSIQQVIFIHPVTAR